MKTTSICVAMIVVAPLIATHTADAHGIAGNRYFDGTLSFDDPAVADEAILPYYAQLDFPAQGSNTSEKSPQLGVCPSAHADIGLYRRWRMASSKLAGCHTSGADKAAIGLTYEAYRDLVVAGHSGRGSDRFARGSNLLVCLVIAADVSVGARDASRRRRLLVTGRF